MKTNGKYFRRTNVCISITKYNGKFKDKNFAIEKGLKIHLDFSVEVHE